LDDFDAIDDKCLYTKSNEWKYEREHRLTKIRGANKAVNFPSECLIGIYFGYNMSYDVIDEIIELTRTRFPNLKYFKMNLSKTKFRFERGEIPAVLD